jgi:hypothetical protein
MKEFVLFVVLVATVCHAAYALVLMRTPTFRNEKPAAILKAFFVGAALSSVLAMILEVSIATIELGYFDPFTGFAVLPMLVVSYVASPIVGIPLLLVTRRRLKKTIRTD